MDTSQNGDKTKTSTTKTATTKTATNPKRRQSKTATDQNGDKPKRRHIQNGDTPKRRQSNLSKTHACRRFGLICRRFGVSPFWMCRRFGCRRFGSVAVLVVAVLVVAVLDLSPFWLVSGRTTYAVSVCYILDLCVSAVDVCLEIHDGTGRYPLQQIWIYWNGNTNIW